MRAQDQGIAAAALTFAGLLAACSSPAPLPSAASTTATPASSEVAVLPVPACDEPPQMWQVDVNGNQVRLEIMLTCEKAVEAAISALPDDHLPITAIEFHYGFYCPPGNFCGFTGPSNGYVVFHTTGRDADLWVQVRADDDGNVSITGGAAPFPPTLGPDG